MTKIAGSGSISQRHGSADPDPDPDPRQNFMDPENASLCKSLRLVQVTVVFNDTEPLYEIPTSLSVVFFIMYITIVLLGTVTTASSPSATYMD